MAIEENASEGLAMSEEWQPNEISELPVDVYLKEGRVVIVATIAGVSPEDLEISVDNGVVSIRGERKRPYTDADLPLLKEECVWGSFHKELIIKENFDMDKVVANIDRGILVLTLPMSKSK